jgi:hypothetical protein
MSAAPLGRGAACARCRGVGEGRRVDDGATTLRARGVQGCGPGSVLGGRSRKMLTPMRVGHAVAHPKLSASSSSGHAEQPDACQLADVEAGRWGTLWMRA